MKKFHTLPLAVLLLIIISGTTAHAQQNKALFYMDKINKELNAIMVDTWDYTSEVAHGKSARMVEIKRKDLVRTSKMAMERVSKMQPYNGSSQYRDSVVSFLNINYLVLKEDYEKILNMEEIAEQSYDKMEAYLLAQELADAKLDSASERMEEQERIFAASNHINLIENQDKVAKKLEKAGAVMKYYHQVYLIFFKCYKQEAYLLDAMIKDDINAMEQNKNALDEVSVKSLEKLKTIPPYKNDKNLTNACKNSLDFYHAEASVKMETIIDFYMQKEKFMKIKKSLDSKPQSTRSREDVDQYNSALAEYNPYLSRFNKVNNEVNRDRSRILDDWNKTVKNFLDKHVPRYK
ncbi:MAG: hypothetical protein NTW10_09465 [Bacteroidetes bacterium]|nr:hypothetical protein [Bacteroidota bacterium]